MVGVASSSEIFLVLFLQLHKEHCLEHKCDARAKFSGGHFSQVMCVQHMKFRNKQIDAVADVGARRKVVYLTV